MLTTFPSDWYLAFLPTCFPSRYKTLGVTPRTPEVRNHVSFLLTWPIASRPVMGFPSSLVTCTCALLADEAVCFLRAASIIPAASEVG